MRYSLRLYRERVRYWNRGRIAVRNISYLLRERESVVSVELFFDTTFVYFTRNMQTPCRKSVDQLWIRELSVNCLNDVYSKCEITCWCRRSSARLQDGQKIYTNTLVISFRLAMLRDGYGIPYFFILSTVTLWHVLRLTCGVIYTRVCNCKRLIWQLWTCVLSLNEVNFIVGYLKIAS